MKKTLSLKVTPWKEYKKDPSNLETAILLRQREVAKCLLELRCHIIDAEVINHELLEQIPDNNFHFGTLEIDATEEEFNNLSRCPVVINIIDFSLK